MDRHQDEKDHVRITRMIPTKGMVKFESEGTASAPRVRVVVEQPVQDGETIEECLARTLVLFAKAREEAQKIVPNGNV